MTKEELNAAVELKATVSGSVTIHPSDGSRWVLWERKGSMYLRPTPEPGIIVDVADRGERGSTRPPQ